MSILKCTVAVKMETSLRSLSLSDFEAEPEPETLWELITTSLPNIKQTTLCDMQ